MRKSRTKRSFWRLPRLTFEGSLVQNARSGDFRGSLFKEVSYKSARSGDFRGSLFKEVSCKTLVLETSAAHFLRKSRTKRSFWRLPLLTFEGSLVQNARSGDFRGSLFKEVSHKTLVLETSAAHFLRKSRTKRSFWRLPRLTFEGSLVQSARSGDFRGSLFKEVSYKTLVLETSAAHF